MSQSAASEALLNFENSYNLKLFDRSSNRLSLNATGRTLRRQAERLIGQCEEFEKSLVEYKELGHIKIGASFTIGNHLVSRYLAGYLNKFPEAEVVLDIANTPEIVSEVLNYEVDIGMIEGQVIHPDLEIIPWMEDELVVFCAADHPFARKKKLTIADIKSADWIMRESDSGARKTFENALADVLPHITIYFEFRHNEAIKNAVEAGIGIGCLSQIVLRKNFSNGDLVPLAMPGRRMKRTFNFILPKVRREATTIEEWMGCCRQSV